MNTSRPGTAPSGRSAPRGAENARLLRNAGEYIRRFLKIRTKDRRLVPLRFNEPQTLLYEAIRGQYRRRVPIRVIILKARQEGMSTATEALIFHRTATGHNVGSLIVAHKEDATANLFRMSKLFYDCLPEPIRPMLKNSNAQELVFENPTRDPEEKKRDPGLRSRMRCATAGGGGVGRSDTLQNVHASEFAFWPGNKMETLAGILQAVPDDPGTLVVIESTANGYDEFKDLWDRAVEDWERGERDGWVPLFLPWWRMSDYRREVTGGFEATVEEVKLRDAYGLDEEQLAWRRWCIKANFGGDVNLFRQEYPASPDEAFIASGRCVFDKESVVLRREQVKRLVSRVGRFTCDYDGLRVSNIQWVDDPQGEIKLFREPEAGRPYVVGGDTAGEGSDFFTGQVLDNITGEQAAVLRQQYDEGLYARQLYCLGWFYNRALLAVESNFSTFPNQELARLGYPRLYVREVPDTYTGQLKKTYGFQTTSATRPVILAELVETAREAMETIMDGETLGEMLTFVRNERGRAEAEVGKHDDLVMAYAIALHARGQQRMTVLTQKEEPVPKLIDKLNRGDRRKRR